MGIKGYKVFNSDWTCRGFQYEVGKTYTLDVEKEGELKLCNAGFHFCTKANDCFRYYDFDSNNHVAEIEALGEIRVGNNSTKCCTDVIKIVRELSWHEVLDLVNTGKDCTGLNNSGYYNSGNRNSGDYNSGDYNSGNRNSGDYNSGNYNSGNRNSGYYNSGNWNSGNRNSGYYNSGNWNSGNRNSGYYNSGNWNSGYWNKTSYSSGCFNTEETPLMFFNQPSDMYGRDWRNSKANIILNNMPTTTVEWMWSEEMTDEEKESHPEYKTANGYLKERNITDTRQSWWESLSDDEKSEIWAIPNFDVDIFKEITGIDARRR